MKSTIGDITRQWLERQGIAVEFSPVSESTSTAARARGFKDPALKVYVADQQLHGRGRGKRTWSNPPPGTALLATWSRELQSPPSHLAGPIVGLALYSAAKAAWPSLPFSIKPPNDLYLAGKKTAGLLLEVVSEGPKHRLLVGLGFNIYQHPEEIDLATHLTEHLGAAFTQEQFEQFLAHWTQSLNTIDRVIHEPKLGSKTIENLTAALKAHPDYGPRTKSVTPQGDIVYEDKTVKWHDL